MHRSAKRKHKDNTHVGTCSLKMYVQDLFYTTLHVAAMNLEGRSIHRVWAQLNVVKSLIFRGPPFLGRGPPMIWIEHAVIKASVVDLSRRSRNI